MSCLLGYLLFLWSSTTTQLTLGSMKLKHASAATLHQTDRQVSWTKLRVTKTKNLSGTMSSMQSRMLPNKRMRSAWSNGYQGSSSNQRGCIDSSVAVSCFEWQTSSTQNYVLGSAGTRWATGLLDNHKRRMNPFVGNRCPTFERSVARKVTLYCARARGVVSNKIRMALGTSFRSLFPSILMDFLCNLSS